MKVERLKPSCIVVDVNDKVSLEMSWQFLKILNLFQLSYNWVTPLLDKEFNMYFNMNFFKDLFILKEFHRAWGRQKIFLFLQQPGLSQAKTRSPTWMAGPNTWAIFYCHFQVISRENGSKFGRQDISQCTCGMPVDAGGSFTCYTAVLEFNINFVHE